MDSTIETIFHSAITWLIPVVLSGIIGTLVKIYKDSIAMKKGLLAMIRSELNKECEKYLKLGYLPEYARYCIDDLFNQYKNLGGNHGMEVLVNKTFSLPTNL